MISVTKRIIRKLRRAITLFTPTAIERLLSKLKTLRNLRKHANKVNRKLEIGPGSRRISDFETLNIVNGPQVDYVCDASKPLPFPDDTFEIIYASHILEHIPWYQSEEVLREWVRVLKRGGSLEIWVPDGLKICQVFVDVSQGLENPNYRDGWLVHNPNADPFLWVAGRLFYGAKDEYPSWHKAAFSFESLHRIFAKIGLKNIQEMKSGERRGGYDHGWINLGVRGTKL